LEGGSWAGIGTVANFSFEANKNRGMENWMPAACAKTVIIVISKHKKIAGPSKANFMPPIKADRF